MFLSAISLVFLIQKGEGLSHDKNLNIWPWLSRWTVRGEGTDPADLGLFSDKYWQAAYCLQYRGEQTCVGSPER